MGGDRITYMGVEYQYETLTEAKERIDHGPPSAEFHLPIVHV